MQKDSSRRRFPLADRVIEVIDDTLTGEVLLDEALKMMKSSEKMSVSSWIDLMSGMQSRPASLLPSSIPVLTMSLTRRNMEPHENRLPTETSPRTPRQRPRRQRHPPHRETQLPPFRHGDPPGRRRRRKRRDPPSRPQPPHQPHCCTTWQPILARRYGVQIHSDHFHGVCCVRGQCA